MDPIDLWTVNKKPEDSSRYCIGGVRAVNRLREGIEQSEGRLRRGGDGGACQQRFYAGVPSPLTLLVSSLVLAPCFEIVSRGFLVTLSISTVPISTLFSFLQPCTGSSAFPVRPIMLIRQKIKNDLIRGISHARKSSFLII